MSGTLLRLDIAVAIIPVLPSADQVNSAFMTRNDETVSARLGTRGNLCALAGEPTDFAKPNATNDPQAFHYGIVRGYRQKISRTAGKEYDGP